MRRQAIRKIRTAWRHSEKLEQMHRKCAVSTGRFKAVDALRRRARFDCVEWRPAAQDLQTLRALGFDTQESNG